MLIISRVAEIGEQLLDKLAIICYIYSSKLYIEKRGSLSFDKLRTTLNEVEGLR